MAGFSKLAHNKLFKLISACLFLFLLAGCMKSATIRDDSQTQNESEIMVDEEVKVARVSPETQQRVNRGQQSAVRSLMRQSRRYVNQGDFSKGAVFLERALKIDAQNALLWSNLADIRFKQKKLALAESLALKSNSYARNDRDLLLRNWRIIAESRSLSGDKDGANRAAAKVDYYKRR